MSDAEEKYPEVVYNDDGVGPMDAGSEKDEDESGVGPDCIVDRPIPDGDKFNMMNVFLPDNFRAVDIPHYLNKTQKRRFEQRYRQIDGTFRLRTYNAIQAISTELSAQVVGEAFITFVALVTKVYYRVLFAYSETRAWQRIVSRDMSVWMVEAYFDDWTSRAVRFTRANFPELLSAYRLAEFPALR
jgi:hypothetical protein